MRAALTSIVLAATLAAGLTGGFLAAFAHTVMPGLGKVDDRAFVGSFQAMDRAVYNGWFMVPFVALPVLTGLGLLAALWSRRPDLIVILALALAFALATVVITGVVHLPLNKEIAEAPLDGPTAQLAIERARFEQRWVTWNVVRAVTATATFLCLAVALVRAP